MQNHSGGDSVALGIVPPPNTHTHLSSGISVPASISLETVQFSSVQSLDRMGRRGNIKDDSAEVLFQSFLQEALVSSSGMGRDVRSLALSSSISSADHDVANSPRCSEGWFWRDCRGV